MGRGIGSPQVGQSRDLGVTVGHVLVKHVIVGHLVEVGLVGGGSVPEHYCRSSLYACSYVRHTTPCNGHMRHLLLGYSLNSE